MKKILLTKTAGLAGLTIIALFTTLLDFDARGWWFLVALWLIFAEWFTTRAERAAIVAEQEEDY